MKFIYQDLLNFLVENPSKKLLSEKLFQLGHEHEIHGDIFDMELTPNRGDCFSLIGLARELNIFFGLKNSFQLYNDDIEELNIEFENQAPEDCPKITFLEIEIEGDIKEYKPYLKNYFTKLANKKVNFFTDISNYISYEQGQPTHCYDKSKIADKKLIFENKICMQSFNTLHGKDIKLQDNNCVFRADDEIINIAGVIGGKSTACSSETCKVLIECAYFKPESIIGKSIKYNLQSDAAHKFERGVDISSHDLVLRRFINIVEDHASIKKLGIKSFSNKNIPGIFININAEKINKILGTELNKDTYIKYLKKLGFEVSKKIKVPTYRHDIKTQNDLAEEIARIIGYDFIKSKPINLQSFKNERIDKASEIRNFFVKKGFYEVINYPFASIEKKKSIKIDNPLDSTRKNLRFKLKDSLLQNLLFNERRQKDSIKLFEISEIYYKEKDEIKSEQRIGIIASGRVGYNYIDFSRQISTNYFMKLLDINSNNFNLKIDEIDRSDLKTKKKDRIFYIEILIDEFPDFLSQKSNLEYKNKQFIKYESISEYPSSIRDFSFSITNIEKYNEVINSIQSFNDANLKESYIFDFYKNNNKEEIKLGIRLIFQSDSKTLSDGDIQKSIKDLLGPIIELEGVNIPGLELN